MRKRRNIGLFAATLAAALTTATITAPTEARPVAADPIVLPDLIDDELLSCTELVPHAISLDDKAVTLDVRVLLDGVSRAKAARAVKQMRKAYAPLDITVAPSYQSVSFTGNDAERLNRQAKRLFDGKRPKGVDVVYTMTSKDLTATGSPLGEDVAGLADCIGGVRFPHRAFAVGETFPEPATGGVIPLPVHHGTAKTMAHEIGHLLGGHHHYTSPEGLFADEPNVLDLMGPTVSLISLRFSTVNSLMVKGHAQLYATP